jgi:hypothetical protein
MAKVENVSMLIGNEQVPNSYRELCRKVRVSAKLRFTPEEIGHLFQVQRLY